jgi:hypothetical protein
MIIYRIPTKQLGTPPPPQFSVHSYLNLSKTSISFQWQGIGFFSFFLDLEKR